VPCAAVAAVCVYVDCRLSAVRLDELCVVTNTIESCAVKVVCDNEELVIFAVYRPHSDTKENFTTKFIDMLNLGVVARAIMCILGDLNINLLVQDSLAVQNFVTELQSLSFLPLITKPTRFPSVNSNAVPSLIDHIWLNTLQQCSSGILLLDITDHLPTFIQIPRINHMSDKFKLKFRTHSPNEVDNFINRISAVDWQDMLQGDIDAQYD
jgi:hypothetical protein